MGSRKRARLREQVWDRSKQACDRRVTFALALLLVISTAAAFHRVPGNGFTNYDDYDYVTKNPHVNRSITIQGIVWAFNIGYASNWHPLTWLSHMLDCQIYGLKPWGHHLTSLLLHIANVLLLFWALGRITGAVWRSALVAGLFGLHPLHVESVAWVSERKDVLCTLFCLLAILAHVRCVQTKALRWKAAMFGAFALALMAKPMAVTLPLVLLILDYWPLKREEPPWPLLREKAPLLVLSLVSGILTLAAQHKGGSVSGLELVPVGTRVVNAALGYVRYLLLMVRPVGLAAHYPYVRELALWQVAGAFALLTGVTGAVVYGRKRYPYLLAGWLWYVVTLAPVIGLVQVGSQSIADRYTYVPLVGVFIALTWGTSDLAAYHRRSRLLAVAAVGVCVVLGILTAGQTRVWRDSIALWSQTLKVAPNEPVAHYNLGWALEESGREDQAIEHYSAAATFSPDLRDAHYNLAVLLHKRGDVEAALHHLREVVRIDPTDAPAHNNLCCILGGLQQFDESVRHGRLAVRCRPDYAEAHRNLAISLCLKGQYTEALEEAQRCEAYGGQMPEGMMDAIRRALAQD